jgi:hypothetical protein
MKNKLKIAILLSSIISASNSFAAGGADLTGVKGTLKNVEKAIKSAVSKAEELYEQNGGGTGTAIDLIDSANTPFLSALSIDADYKVTITFFGSSGTAFANTSGSGTSATIPVAQALMGGTIKLIPIHNEGDAVINSWECITDVDNNAKAFIGTSAGAVAGNISLISTKGNNGTNEYLSNCIYVESTTPAVSG